MRPSVLSIAGAAVLLAAAPNVARAQESSVQSVAWMQGCWLASSGASSTEEVWMPPRGGLMMGMSRSVRDGVATGFEFVLLREVEGALVFSASPSGQTPADFVASLAAPDLLRVENANHDFPQKIEYRPAPPDSMIASVYGDVDASTPAFQVRYRRMPCASERGR